MWVQTEPLWAFFGTRYTYCSVTARAHIEPLVGLTSPSACPASKTISFTTTVELARPGYRAAACRTDCCLLAPIGLLAVLKRDLAADVLIGAFLLKQKWYLTRTVQRRSLGGTTDGLRQRIPWYIHALSQGTVNTVLQVHTGVFTTEGRCS